MSTQRIPWLNWTCEFFRTKLLTNQKSMRKKVLWAPSITLEISPHRCWCTRTDESSVSFSKVKKIMDHPSQNRKTEEILMLETVLYTSSRLETKRKTGIIDLLKRFDVWPCFRLNFSCLPCEYRAENDRLWQPLCDGQRLPRVLYTSIKCEWFETSRRV